MTNDGDSGDNFSPTEVEIDRFWYELFLREPWQNRIIADCESGGFRLQAATINRWAKA